MEVLRRLGPRPSTPGAPPACGVYKVGLVYPLEPTRISDVRAGPGPRCWSIEEKGPIVESQLQATCSTTCPRRAPARWSASTERDGRPLLSRARRAAAVAADRAGGRLARGRSRARASTGATCVVRLHAAPQLLSNGADAVQAAALLLLGLPAQHRRPRCRKARRALAGIGCHFMANWMEREHRRA